MVPTGLSRSIERLFGGGRAALAPAWTERATVERRAAISGQDRQAFDPNTTASPQDPVAPAGTIPTTRRGDTPAALTAKGPT